jgi:subtilisin family serine protease
MKMRYRACYAAITLLAITTGCAPAGQFNHLIGGMFRTTQSNSTSLATYSKKMFPLSNPGSIMFDQVPNFQQSEPGQITIIFKDENKVRPRPNYKSVGASTSDVALAINKILNDNGIVSIGGPADVTQDENKLAEYERMVTDALGCDVPNWRSIQTLTFGRNANTSKISAELRKMPAVRTAYPTPRITSCAGSVYSVNQFINLFPPSPPTDTVFQPANDLAKQRDDWWWFSRYLIFQGWSQYDSNYKGVLPKVAVIDTGFYQGPDQSADIPVYDNTQAAAYGWAGIYLGTDVSEPTSNTDSHGTKVASVLASPKGNSIRLSGVAPSAVLVPVKADTNSWATINAIYHAANNTNATTLCLSRVTLVNGVQTPLTADPATRAAISYAIWSKNKTVVIAAGNDGAVSTKAVCPKVGEIVVGGSQGDGYEWPYSNYGNAVDMVAGAYQINTQTYNPQTGQVLFGKEDGTSMATPMVAAVAAMMWAVAPQGTTPELIRQSLVAGSNFAKAQNAGKYLGADLTPGENYNINLNGVAHMRELNAAHSMAILLNSGRQKMVRICNAYDDVYATKNSTWTTPPQFYAWGQSDQLFDISLDGYSTGTTLNSKTISYGGHNHSSAIQYFLYGVLYYENVDGVAVHEAPWACSMRGAPYNVPLYSTVGSTNDNSSGTFNSQSYVMP